MAKALPVFAVDPDAALLENAPLILHTRLEEMYRFAPLIADPARVEELHAMRIAAKRLRYTMEVFAPAFLPRANAKEYAALYDIVKDMQEQIGEIHDADVRAPLLRDFAERHAPARPEIRVGLDTLARRERERRDQTYQKFLTDWNARQVAFKRRFLQLLVPADAPPEKETPTDDRTLFPDA